MAAPALNWKELEILLRDFADSSRDLFLDRIVVPARPRFPEGYLKGEWALRLADRKREGVLLFSIRTRAPYIAWIEGRGPAAAEKATRSPFDLALGKQIRGARLLEIELYPRERVLTVWFQAPGTDARKRLGLVVALIPALPEALLVEDPGNGTAGSEKGYPILARSRQKGDEPVTGRFVPPNGSRAPADPPVREELVQSSKTFLRTLERELDREAFEFRLRAALRAAKERADLARGKIRLSEKAIAEAEKEPDWQHRGDLLKASLPDAPPLRADGTRLLLDYTTGVEESVPCDPKLSPQDQVHRFYQLARRKQRRLSEARTRLQDGREALARAEGVLAHPPEALDWKALEAMEGRMGLQPSAQAQAPAIRARAKHGGWQGKTFLSKDGWTIWVGRSKDENLELTFRHARGNDLWMHVRGRPGSHVLIPVQPGKSVPLETLLDAATLCLYYSGGESWGKTEVDYTFKKHVKRIKDSTEASYVQNKTLIVECDAPRIRRLFQHES